MGNNTTCSSFSCCGHVHRCWMEPLDQTALHKVDSWSSLQTPSCCKAEHRTCLISWHSSRLKRVARSSSAAETQAAAEGDDEAVYIRMCKKEVLFGQLELQNWQSERDEFLLWWLTVVVSTTLGSLFVLLSWSERQEIWPGGTCAQTESRLVWNNDTLVSFCGTVG